MRKYCLATPANNKLHMTKYRSRIYERYATCFQDEDENFDVNAADRWGKAFDWYLRG